MEHIQGESLPRYPAHQDTTEIRNLVGDTRFMGCKYNNNFINLYPLQMGQREYFVYLEGQSSPEHWHDNFHDRWSNARRVCHHIAFGAASAGNLECLEGPLRMGPLTLEQSFKPQWEFRYRLCDLISGYLRACETDSHFEILNVVSIVASDEKTHERPEPVFQRIEIWDEIWTAGRLLMFGARV